MACLFAQMVFFLSFDDNLTLGSHQGHTLRLLKGYNKETLIHLLRVSSPEPQKATIYFFICFGKKFVWIKFCMVCLWLAQSPINKIVLLNMTNVMPINFPLALSVKYQRCFKLNTSFKATTAHASWCHHFLIFFVCVCAFLLCFLSVRKWRGPFLLLRPYLSLSDTYKTKKKIFLWIMNLFDLTFLMDMSLVW